MTIASEIASLQTNLQAAKNAVVTKGGTIGDTGLAGLASEISSIPSGGGGDWGTVTYLDNDSEVTLTIQSAYEYFSLGTDSVAATPPEPAIIDGQSVPMDKIIGVSLGTDAEFTPYGFLAGAGRTSNQPLTISGLENVIELGGCFLYQAKYFNSPIVFSNKLERIGRYFMRECVSFTQPLTVPSSVTYIGTYFLYLAGKDPAAQFTGPLTVETAAAPTDIYSLVSNTIVAPMYSTGVTLLGTYAQAWKTALPDRSTQPYRKLIIGS